LPQKTKAALAPVSAQPGCDFRLIASAQTDYSIFTSTLYRNRDVEWLFPQEKATFHTVAM
jgi:hypothetical protein